MNFFSKSFGLESVFVLVVIYLFMPAFAFLGFESISVVSEKIFFLSVAAVSDITYSLLHMIYHGTLMAIVGFCIFVAVAVFLRVFIRLCSSQPKCYLADIIYTVLLSTGMNIPDQFFSDTAAILYFISAVDEKINSAIGFLPFYEQTTKEQPNSTVMKPVQIHNPLIMQSMDSEYSQDGYNENLFKPFR